MNNKSKLVKKLLGLALGIIHSFKYPPTQLSTQTYPINSSITVKKAVIDGGKHLFKL